MFCYKCGHELSESSKFCPKCGTPVESIDTTSEEPKSTINYRTAKTLDEEFSSTRYDLGTRTPKTNPTNKHFITIFIVAVIIVFGIIAKVIINKNFENNLLSMVYEEYHDEILSHYDGCFSLATVRPTGIDYDKVSGGYIYTATYLVGNFNDSEENMCKVSINDGAITTNFFRNKTEINGTILYQKVQEPDPASATSTDTIDPDFFEEAFWINDLKDACAANVFSFVDTWEGKRICVDGYVDHMDTDLMGTRYIRLRPFDFESDSFDYDFYVTCYLAGNGGELTQYIDGNNYCTITGELMPDSCGSDSLFLKNCYVYAVE